MTMLDFGLGETADLLRETVRRFASEQIAPFAADYDANNKFPRHLLPELFFRPRLHTAAIVFQEGSIWGIGGSLFVRLCSAIPNATQEH